MRVWRPRGTACGLRYLVPNLLSGELRKHFYTAITFGARTALVMIRRRRKDGLEGEMIEGDSIRSRQCEGVVLGNYLAPIWEDLQGDAGGMELMQDSSGPHRSNKLTNGSKNSEYH